MGREFTPSKREFQYLEWAGAGLIFFILAAGLRQLFITNINWDEFYFLSLIHLYRGGDLTLQWQTFHVHFFSWLPLVAESEITQIFAARSVVWIASLASTWLIYRIAGRFCTRLGALIAVIFYLSFSYVMEHGISFRADPFCVLFILTSIHLLVNKADRAYALPLAAFFLAVAVMVSLKSVFFLPTIAVLLMAPVLAGSWQWAPVRKAAIFGVCFVVSLTALFYWHSRSLAPIPLAEAGAYVGAVGAKTLASGKLLPAWPFVARAMTENPLTWVLIACGLWVAGRRFVSAERRVEAAMVLSLALPLISLLIYRNAFPYFFVFVMPTAVILAAVAVDYLVASAAIPRGRAVVGALAILLAVPTAAYSTNYAQKLSDQTVAQAETVQLVHELFPKPVPYIDRNSMISSFPKVGFFMSTWGLESYRAAKRPIMADIIAQRAPPLLIANTPALDLLGSNVFAERRNKYSLFQADFKVLKENYVPHWGAVYVAGKRLELPAGAGPSSFEILIAGTYTLETDGLVAIDGARIVPGAYITLTRGPHTVAAVDGAPRRVTLRWGRDLYVPAQPPSPQPIYIAF